MFKNGKETNYEQNLLKVFALQNDHFCVDKLMILNYLPTQYLLAYEYVLIPIKLFNIKQCNALYKLNQITSFLLHTQRTHQMQPSLYEYIRVFYHFGTRFWRVNTYSSLSRFIWKERTFVYPGHAEDASHDTLSIPCLWRHTCTHITSSVKQFDVLVGCGASGSFYRLGVQWLTTNLRVPSKEATWLLGMFEGNVFRWIHTE